MATPARKYSCRNAAETLEWMNAVTDFLRPFRPLLDSHVVNFFKVVGSGGRGVDGVPEERIGGESAEYSIWICSGLLAKITPGFHTHPEIPFLSTGTEVSGFGLQLLIVGKPSYVSWVPTIVNGWFCGPRGAMRKMNGCCNSFYDAIKELFSGGTDSSSVTIEWAMAELMRNPDNMNKAQMEIRHAMQGKTKLGESDISKLKYLKLVIMETLRLHPPAPMLIRVCRESCRVQGYEIRQGTRVIVNVWALARDAKCWEDADCFKPERFEESTVSFKGADSCFLPFGAGRRMCPGMTFGMANVEIALANLLFYFDWKLPRGMKANELDMKESFSAIVPRKLNLCLLATTRVPLPMR